MPKKNHESTEELAKALEADLISQYGPTLTGDPLRRALSYPTMGAMRKAVYRGTVPVPLFKFPKRRGQYALAKDIGLLLAELRNAALVGQS